MRDSAELPAPSLKLHYESSPTDAQRLQSAKAARKQFSPWSLAATLLLAWIFLFSFASTKLPLDQDLGSKAAKIESLAKAPIFTSPTHAPLYYREAYFSFYYQVEALTAKLTSLSGVAVSGYSAVICGVLCLAAFNVYLKTLTGIGPWWTLFLFLNTPALVTNFLYGNEVSFSIAMVSASAALIVLRKGRVWDIASGCILGLAFFCRPDIVLLAPFIVALLCTVVIPDHRLVLRLEWLRIISVGVAGVVVAGAYWLVEVRALPNETDFPWIIDWRIFASYIIFGFGPVAIALAAWGGWKRASLHGVIQMVLPATTIAPLFYYFRDLGSTKYILGLAFGTLLCAGWAIANSGYIVKALSFLIAALFWVVSITPFGIFGPARGGHWVIPAGHGPVVFGSYAGFYREVHDGFFGYRYLAAEKAWAEVVSRLTIDHQPTRLIGSSDDHMLDLLCEQRGISKSSLKVLVDRDGDYIHQPGRQVMFFNGYSRLSYLTARDAEAQVRDWLAKGMVQRFDLQSNDGALPYAVEIGPTVTKGSRELAQRILFVDRYSHGGGIAPLSYYTRDYGAFCFVPAWQNPPDRVYTDSEYSATTNCPNNAEIWGNWWPTVYYERGADRARTALIGHPK